MSHRFRVWAPAARSVEVVLCGGRHPMEAEPGGWWALADPGAGPGHDYRFSVDGGPPLPDPRSRRQPEGVHGPSRIVDLGAVTWTDDAWRGAPIEEAVIYELHVGTFTPEGTLDGVVGRLDHLVDLGVTAVELMPVASFPGRRGWGYDGVDLWAVHEGYGGPEALCRLVDACHARGLAILLDVVYNHLGPDGDNLAEFGPYFTDSYATLWGRAVNVDDAGSDEVRAFIVENAVMWLRDYHLDGLRLDAVHAIVDTAAMHILEELGVAVAALEEEMARRLWLIAESDANDPRLVWPRERGGFGLTAQWSDDLHHSLHAALTGETSGYYADYGRLDDVARALTDGVVYAGRHSEHRGRRLGRSHRGVPGYRLVACTQNHDQVGNRAGGERTATLVGPAGLRAAAATLLVAAHTPLLFMGEEWGASSPFLYFTDHTDPDLAASVTSGRRQEFAAFGRGEEDVPDPQDVATFERSRLRWEEVGEAAHATLLEWYRSLVALRRDRADLHDGHLAGVAAEADEVARTLTVRRGGVVLTWNLGDTVSRVALTPGAPGRWALAAPAPPEVVGEIALVPPGTTAVWVAAATEGG